MPPPGFQFPGTGFQAGPGLHPGCPAGKDHQDYLEGSPQPSHGKKDPHAGESDGDLTADKAEELIPIDTDGEDGSDCEIIEVMGLSTGNHTGEDSQGQAETHRPGDAASSCEGRRCSCGQDPRGHFLF